MVSTYAKMTMTSAPVHVIAAQAARPSAVGM